MFRRSSGTPGSLPEAWGRAGPQRDAHKVCPRVLLSRRAAPGVSRVWCDSTPVALGKLG